MKNWMVELENRTDSEMAQFVAGMVALALMVTAIIMGNWRLLF